MEKSVTAIIKEFLKDSGITQVHLAAELEESPQNLANKLRKRDLDTGYVRRISIALNHDFFLDLSRQMKSYQLKNDAPTGVETDEPEYQLKYMHVLEENIQLFREIMELKSGGKTKE